jgi:hypothetical protein
VECGATGPIGQYPLCDKHDDGRCQLKDRNSSAHGRFRFLAAWAILNGVHNVGQALRAARNLAQQAPQQRHPTPPHHPTSEIDRNRNAMPPHLSSDKLPICGFWACLSLVENLN